MKVPIKTNQIDVACYSKDCPFKKECANHISAGDFREEGGFMPKIRKENNEYFCDTYDMPPLKGKPDFPADFYQLKRGAICTIDLDRLFGLNEKELEFMRCFPDWDYDIPKIRETHAKLNGRFNRAQLRKILELLQ